MALICSISKEIAEHPVLSPYGHIYERRLVEKYISQFDKDPETGKPLTVEQLIDIKVSPVARPRPADATSIPALCKLLLDEWDAVMLAYYTEKNQHFVTKRELSHSLYQQDSACRVIARLQKEVTAAREALATLKPQIVAAVSAPVGPARPQTDAPAKNSMEVEEEEQSTTEFKEEIMQKLQEHSAQLTVERKKRGKTLPEGLTTPEKLQNYKQTASHVALHSASTPGILAVDICLSDTSKIVTGGKDKNAVVFDMNTESIVAVLEGHTKKVTNVVYHPTENLVFTGSQDQTVRVWGVGRSSPCEQIIKAHRGSVTGLSLHPIGDYLLSCGEDKHWAFSDVRNGSVLIDAEDNQALTCAQFHPDGLIFGTGTTDGSIRIWDLKEKSNVANFSGHRGAITSIAFSENGYHLATSAEENVVKLWDLRKLKNFKNITLDDNHEITSLKFDNSGSYLAIGGTDVRVYHSKQWSELAVFNNHSALATGVCFGQSASFLTSVSLDRSLKIFSL